jgi:hypothetical protein
MPWYNLDQPSKLSGPGLSLPFVGDVGKFLGDLDFKGLDLPWSVFPGFTATSLLNSAMKFWKSLFIVHKLSKSIPAWQERSRVACWSLSV